MNKPTFTYHHIGFKTNYLKIIGCFIILFISSEFLQAQIVAFPNAEGFGKYASGGRGGEVIKVTNLNDSGSGSFREALEANGARTIIFEVGGTIVLDAPIYIHNGDVTIAGQTAPGDGILIRGSLISVEASNVIFRYIRFRPGPAAPNASDALSLTAWQNNIVEDIIIDHCSFSWADDENFNVRGVDGSNPGFVRDVTIQNCIISEGNYATLATQNTFNLTFYKNLFAHNNERSIRSGYPTDGTFAFEMINNLIYGYRWATSPSLGAKFTVLNNHYRASSETTVNGAAVEGTAAGQTTPSETHAFISGNIVPAGVSEYNTSLDSYIRTFPYNNSGIDAIDASLIVDDIISHVGCSFPNRDAVDIRVIEQFNNGNGTVQSSGTYPIIQNGTAPTDTDNDGMPDNWELDNGLDINDPNDRNYVNSDGYTNLEHYLNWITLGNSVNAGEDTTICEGSLATLSATDADSYLWSTGETTESISVSPSTTTTYSVIGTHNDGSSTSDEVTVYVSDIPDANAGEDETICEGENITLTATGGSSFEWSTGESGASVVVSPSTTTEYSVTVYDNGCESQDSITVFVNPIPVADAGEDVTIDEGQSSVLTATGGDSYLWSTGETTQSITVSPLTTTTYEVSVTNGDCDDLDSVTVNVNATANADAGEDVTICEGDSVILTATGGNTYEWNTGETTQSITVSPDANTSYSVTVFSGATQDMDSVTVFVAPNPEASASEDITILHGESTTLSASGGDSYLWSNGETTQSIIVTPTESTTYTVTVYSNGCQDSDSVNVILEANADAGEDVTICEGDSTVLTASGGSTYLWNTGETTESITVNPETDTEFSVTVYSGSTSDTDSVYVYVNPLPNANAGEDVTIDEGESITLTAIGGDTYLWDTGDTTQSITVSPDETTNYSVTVFSNGCQDSDDILVIVEIVADAGDDITICEGQEAILTASAGESYLWSTGETTQNITVNPIEDTTYTVTVFSGNSSSSDDVAVYVNPIPNADAGEDVNINEGESTVLFASGGDSYEWSTGETTQSITVSPIEDTTYTVFVTANGCDNFDEVTVSVNLAANANAGEDVGICENDSVTLTATGGDTYLWSTGETTQSITVSPVATSNYTVIVSNDFSSDTDEVTVFVNPPPNVEVTENMTILEGEFVTLSASGANNYLWSNGATQPNIAVSPSATTTYSVTGYINNCSDTTNVTVNVLEEVHAYAGDDMSICRGETITLTASATGGDSYLWNTGETSQSIQVDPQEDTLYTVIVSNELDSDAADVMVFVDDCIVDIEESDFEYAIYTTRLNPDIFTVRLAGLEGPSKLVIHDVTGKLVYAEDLDDNNGQPFERFIDPSRYGRGIYLVTLFEGIRQTTKRILFH